MNRIGWQAFLGGEPGATNVPDYALPARREDFSGLPAAWNGTGDIDLFYDEDKAYADQLEAVPGAFHGFEELDTQTKLVQDYLSCSRDWLRDQLALF